VSESGVVDDDVDASAPVDRSSDHRRATFDRRNVSGIRDRISAGIDDRLNDRAGGVSIGAASAQVGAEIVHHDRRPVTRERHGMRSADAPPATGDERDPSGQRTGTGHDGGVIQCRRSD
jgi:hypothetical protein